MIKQLHYKFVTIIMSVLLLVIVSIISALNIFTYKTGEIQSRHLMAGIAQNNGTMIMPSAARTPFAFVIPNPNPPIAMRNLFTVKLNSDNEITDIKYDKVALTSDVELDKLILSVIKKNKSFGKVDHYWFYIQQKQYGSILVFMDDSAEMNLCNRLLILSILIGCISLFVLFFLSLFLSRLAIKPVKETFEKQKQFISDASHELKTPLSVINVNADVLENNIGSNKWLGYIKSETDRMSQLVNQLLTIARLDDMNTSLNVTEFNISQAFMQIILPFESTAYESSISYQYDIDENIFFVGEEVSLKQLLAILIDNAIKNTKPNGEVKIILKKHSSKLILEVYNTGKGISEDEKEKIFERFYCSDPSRARERGGYGLGLSIAKSIVTAHHGKITVQSELGEWAKFTVTL